MVETSGSDSRTVRPDTSVNSASRAAKGYPAGAPRTSKHPSPEVDAAKARDKEAIDAMKARKIAAPCDPVTCPKCGSSETWMRLEPRRHFRHSRSFTDFAGTHYCGDGEHFDRGCRTCHYEWSTADVLEVKSACPLW